MKNSILLLLLLWQTTLLAQATINPDFETKIESIIDHSIPTISCRQLKHKMKHSKIYVLDAREKKEYNISHLRAAKWVGYNDFEIKRVQKIPQNATLIVYCSIGYRSEKIGEKLKANGYTKVYNLYGGIFEWTNKGYRVISHGRTTKEVHAYNTSWGKWVEKAQKVY